MRYVQSLPPLVEPAAEETAVNAVAHVTAAHNVTEQHQALIAYRKHMGNAAELPAINQSWVPRLDPIESDRRKFCRRLQNSPMLHELRSGKNRRLRNQRKGDITTAIDEKA